MTHCFPYGVISPGLTAGHSAFEHQGRLPEAADCANLAAGMPARENTDYRRRKLAERDYSPK